MKLRICLVSLLAVGLTGTACGPETPSPAVVPAEAVLDSRLVGIWRLIDPGDDSVHVRVAAFDEHQLLVEWVTPAGCGSDCFFESCQEPIQCSEDPVFGTVDIFLFRVLVTEVGGSRWVSICPIWIWEHIELAQEGTVPEEYRPWTHGRLSFLPGDTVLVEMLADGIEGTEGATTPEAVRALLTEENLSIGKGERFVFVRMPADAETASSSPGSTELPREPEGRGTAEGVP